MRGHIHAFAEAAEVPGMRHICAFCGHLAFQPQVCTEPVCGSVACLACITPAPAPFPTERAA